MQDPTRDERQLPQRSGSDEPVPLAVALEDLAAVLWPDPEDAE